MNDKTIKNHTNTLCLFLENKFGALEKVIGAFTLRGHKIENLICTQSKFSNLFDMKISLNCSDKDLEKIVKILHNQIHVLEIRLLMEENSSRNREIVKAS